MRKKRTNLKIGTKVKLVPTLACLGSLVILLVLNIAAGPNLIVNGDFEKDPIDKGNGWYIADVHGNKGKDIWGVFDGVGGGYLGTTWATDFYRSPGHSGRIFQGLAWEWNSMNPSRFCQGVSNLAPNTRYTVSFWSKNGSPTEFHKKSCVDASMYSDGNLFFDNLNLMTQKLSNTYDWKEDHFSFTTQGVKSASFSLSFGESHHTNMPIYPGDPLFDQRLQDERPGDPYYNCTDFSGGKFWLDDVSLTRDDVQPLDRSGWTVSASREHDYYGDHRYSMSKAIDGWPGTSWIPVIIQQVPAQTPGDWFRIDMGSPQTFNKILIEEPKQLEAFSHPEDLRPGLPTDYIFKTWPVSYEVYVSNDGTNWGNSVASGAGTSNTTINFPTPYNKRYIKVVQTGTGPDNWEIAEINLYNTGTTNNNTPISASIRSAVHSLSDNSFYTTTGRRIDMRSMRTKGAGVYLIKKVDERVSKVFFKY